MTHYYHIFPFEKIKKGSRIILYGAGEVGQWYLHQLRATQYAEVVAIIDKNWNAYPCMSVPVVGLDALLHIEYEYVVVSIESKGVARQIASFLEEHYKVRKDAVVLGCESLAEYPEFKKKETETFKDHNSEQKQSTNKPKISIIIPVYNAGKYLRECLDSVRDQYFADFEVICINDGSEDKSNDILNEFASRDKRFMVLQNPRNLGAPRTRNIGLQIAQGAYVTIWDADDYYKPEYLSSMYKRITELGADVCFCTIEEYDVRTGEKTEMCAHPDSFTHKLKNGFTYKDIQPDFFLQFGIPPFTKLIRREFIMENNIQFQDIPGCNDIYFGCMVVLLAKQMAYCPFPLVKKHINWGGNISSKRVKNPMVSYRACKKIRQTLLEYGLMDSCRKAFNCACACWIGWGLMESNSVEYLKFLQSEGLRDLDIEGLSRDDFCQPWEYERYQMMTGQIPIKTIS